MVRKPYTPERAFRISVVPLSIFFIVGGAVLAIAAAVRDGRSVYMPPLGPTGAKLALGAVGLALVAIGAGMLLKLRLAWYGLIAYLALGGVWNLVLGIGFAVTPPDGGRPGALFHFLAAALAVLFGGGLCFVTRPVFRGKGRSGDAPVSDERPPA
jgi:hypothetical protein